MARRSTNFSLAVKTEGGMFPTDFLLDLASLSKEIEGLKPEQYHLSDREKINEAINQAYSRLQGFWLSFKDAFEKLPLDDYATSATREKWLLPLFDCLGYGRLTPAEAVTVGDRQYKPSHMRESVAIHLVGFRVDLDKRSTAGGARSSSPHSLVQELLNQSDNHLWAFVSNGRKLRLLRDNVSLTKQAFIEFDLESIFEGDSYSDFRLLWLLCHQSRLEGNRPEECWLERWKITAMRSGIRVRDQLRTGVEKALEIFGTGFLRHRSNDTLRTQIRSGEINADEYYRQLMRLIYRLLFLFVTEDKQVLLKPETPLTQKKNYYDYYSTARLRAVAGKRRGTSHDDLWANLSLVFAMLSSDNGCEKLGLPALGSFLWSSRATPALDGCLLHNTDCLEALRNLCFTTESGVRRPVQYDQLESEELGSIYESLLEQIPFLDADDRQPTFELRNTAGSERKTTGSYYTPTSLVNCLLDSALEPILNRLATKSNAENEILNLKICDPACGSGHFLIAAAHRIAKRLASVRSGDLEPGPEFTNTALRDIVSRCIYGTDANEMAVELCKVSLWLQSATAGIPLSFLDHKIKCGNSLFGATPELIENGLPDAAFEPLEGDDKEIVKRVKAANRNQTDGYLIPGLLKYEKSSLEKLGASLVSLDLAPGASILDLYSKEKTYAKLLTSDLYVHEKFICDAWCAAFVWKLSKDAPQPITRESFGRIRSDYRNMPEEMRLEIIRLREQYKFFHWHLEFPQVFNTKQSHGEPNQIEAAEKGGFDLVIGNPPWERFKIQEQEWFASKAPEISQAKTASIRSKMITDLARNNPQIYKDFSEAKRIAEGESHFVRRSGRFPLCGRGDVNTYSIFAETNLYLVSTSGQIGCILPSGIATDDTTKYFFQQLVRSNSIVSLLSFENEEFIFPAVHHATKFCLLTLRQKSEKNHTADFVFFARKISDLADSGRHFRLTSADIELINPNTKTCPIFRSAYDAELTKLIYRTVPILIDESAIERNYWRIEFCRLFDMTNDSSLFRTKEDLPAEAILDPTDLSYKLANGKQWLRLYEAKMFHHFDHRFGSYEGQSEAQARQGKLPELSEQDHRNPKFLSRPKFWISEDEVKERIKDKWNSNWLISFRDITSAVSSRTMIATIIPAVAVGNNGPLIFLEKSLKTKALCLQANLSTFVLDFVARTKVGGTHMNFFILNQLPVLKPTTFDQLCPWAQNEPLVDWINKRVIELTYTSFDLSGFGADFGYEGPPFKWDQSRRSVLKAELDAAFAYLYSLAIENLEYIFDQFRVVREKEEALFGTYLSKELAVEIFKDLKICSESHTNYVSRLTPPPGDDRNRHQES